ncbi:Mechanosensitive ion channel-domain-containing protein [Tribonema minus]|uniref:Mechanosensitive ion channel-domain-containing protein n=1 Tax=Tribonema minus TaxID=303371 RepID=A0A835YNU8_9STRA|nr:Mechanosensitive ion channel-domain-containing protein [Tribonema minus]
MLRNAKTAQDSPSKWPLNPSHISTQDGCSSGAEDSPRGAIRDVFSPLTAPDLESPAARTAAATPTELDHLNFKPAFDSTSWTQASAHSQIGARVGAPPNGDLGGRAAQGLVSELGSRIGPGSESGARVGAPSSAASSMYRMNELRSCQNSAYRTMPGGAAKGTNSVQGSTYRGCGDGRSIAGSAFSGVQLPRTYTRGSHVSEVRERLSATCHPPDSIEVEIQRREKSKMARIMGVFASAKKLQKTIGSGFDSYSSWNLANEEPEGWDEPAEGTGEAIGLEPDAEDEPEDDEDSENAVFEHLGELPMMTLRKEARFLVKYLLIALAIFAPGAIIEKVHGCILVRGQCLFVWASLAGMAVASYPFTAMAIKTLVMVLCNSRFIHSNHVYFFVRLHYASAQLMWAVFIYLFWKYGLAEYKSPNMQESTDRAVGRVLACYMVSRIVYLLNKMSLLELANRYMWRPYLERVQANIFAQYVILILTDYSLGYVRNDQDQYIALQFSENQGNWDKMSMYAISRAMGFIPKNKLRHPVFAGSAGSVAMDSKRSARMFAGLLFDRLVNGPLDLARNDGPAPATAIAPPPPPPAPKSPPAELGSPPRARDADTTGGVRRRSPSPARRVSSPPQSRGVVEVGVDAAVLRAAPSLHSVQEAPRQRGNSTTATAAVNASSHTATAAIAGLLRRASGSVDRNNSSASAMMHRGGGSKESLSNSDAKYARGSTSGDRRGSKASTQGTGGVRHWNALKPPERKSLAAEPFQDRGAEIRDAFTDDAEESHRDTLKRLEAAHLREQMRKRALGLRLETAIEENEDDQAEEAVRPYSVAELKSPDESDDEDDPSPPKTLTLWMLRPVMIKQLAVKTMALLDGDTAVACDAEITRHKFQNAMVTIYQQRRSLALTLKDYESILIKLGYVISLVWSFIALFVFLWIFDQNILGLGVTWVSLVVAFSFLFGSSAANFFESCVFIFVTRAYDVGDRVYIKDELNDEANYVVQRINMLTTVFRRWDDHYTILPNQQLAKREIRNMRRSGDGVMLMTLLVSIATPRAKLEALKERMQEYARAVTGPLYSCDPNSVDYCCRRVISCTNMEVFFVYSQKGSWQDNYLKVKNFHLMSLRLAEVCHELGLEYALPTQGVTLKTPHSTHTLPGGLAGGPFEGVAKGASFRADVAATLLILCRRSLGCRYGQKSAPDVFMVDASRCCSYAPCAIRNSLQLHRFRSSIEPPQRKGIQAIEGSDHPCEQRFIALTPLVLQQLAKVPSIPTVLLTSLLSILAVDTTPAPVRTQY